MKLKREAGSGLLAVVLALAAAEAHAATLIYSQSRSIQSGSPYSYVELGGAGTYDIQLTSEIDIGFIINAGWNNHYDVFRAPAPQPHNTVIVGNNYDEHTTFGNFASSYASTFIVPETTINYFIADASYLNYGVTPGTELYVEQRYEDPYVWLWAYPMSAQDGVYTLTITRRDPVPPVDPPAGVPEPSTWLLLTLGFGVLGARLRTGAQSSARRS